MFYILLILKIISKCCGLMDKIGIIGAGKLGTALAQVISCNVSQVILFSRRKIVVNSINNDCYNNEYYPDVKLNANIKATNSFEDLKNCSIIFLSIPSSAFRQILENLNGIINDKTILVTTVKGIEYPSLQTMGSIIEEYYLNPYVVLSGPNFASEIILNLPTVTNISSKDKDSSQNVKKVMETEQFKVKIIDDLKGLEMCGIIKNVNAIAYGICEGMKINENARYAILTKGINDTLTIIQSIGGKKDTVFEYCGLGDLILTSTSIESRNHTLGILYGQSIVVDEKATGILFEGKNSIKALKKICINNKINSIIVDFVYDVIINRIPPKVAFNILWNNIDDW